MNFIVASLQYAFHSMPFTMPFTVFVSQYSFHSLHITVCIVSINIRQSYLCSPARFYTSHFMPYMSYRMYTVCEYNAYKACLWKGCTIQGNSESYRQQWFRHTFVQLYDKYPIKTGAFDKGIQVFNCCQGVCNLGQLIHSTLQGKVYQYSTV